MAISVSSKRFTVPQMEAGTDPDAWFATLTITTWHGVTQSTLGSNSVLLTVVYE